MSNNSRNDFDSLFNDLMQQSSSTGGTKNHPEIGLVSFELGWSHWAEDENGKGSLVFTKEQANDSDTPALQMTRKAGDALNRESEKDRVNVLPVLSKNKKNMPYVMFIPPDANERSKKLPTLWNSLKNAFGEKLNDYLKNGTPFYAELMWHVNKRINNGVEKEYYTPCVARVFATKEEAMAEVEKQNSGTFDVAPFEPEVYKNLGDGSLARAMDWTQFANMVLDEMRKKLANVNTNDEKEFESNVLLAATETFTDFVSPEPENYSEELVNSFVTMYLASSGNVPF